MIRLILVCLFCMGPVFAQNIPSNPLAQGYILKISLGEHTYELAGRPYEYIRMVKEVEGFQIAYHIPTDMLFIKTPYVPNLLSLSGKSVRGGRLATAQVLHIPATKEKPFPPQAFTLISKTKGQTICGQGIGRTDYAQHTGLDLKHVMTVLNTLNYVVGGKIQGCVFETLRLQAVDANKMLLTDISALPFFPQTMETPDGLLVVQSLVPIERPGFIPPQDTTPFTPDLRKQLQQAPNAGLLDGNGKPINVLEMGKILLGDPVKLGLEDPSYVPYVE